MTQLSRQRHPEGLVGKLWRINDPKTVRVGDCFLNGRLLKGDLFLCLEHSGDCFQTYAYVAEYANRYELRRKCRLGSYGIGDAIALPLTETEAESLLDGGYLDREWMLGKEKMYG